MTRTQQIDLKIKVLNDVLKHEHNEYFVVRMKKDFNTYGLMKRYDNNMVDCRAAYKTFTELCKSVSDIMSGKKS